MMRLRVFSDEKLFDLLKDSCIKESIYWTERKYFPASEELVTTNERDEMIAYLLEVCERADMSFSIETFTLTVTLLDRFLASFKVKSKYLECLAVACLYIVAKVREEDEKISITSEFLYDCKSKCSVSELLRMELMILGKFEWSIDDTTTADFLYIFHAILVNKYNAFTEANKKPSLIQNKWKIQKCCLMPNENQGSAFPPSALDILHVLEYKLKQILCSHEIATVWRPRIIALALLSIQVDKVFEQEESLASKVSIKLMLNEVMQNLKQQAKISNENLAACKVKVTDYLEQIDADKNLLDSYMDQYYSEMARNHRASSRLSVTLSSIANHLTAIKEEDETEEQLIEKQPRILTSISNNYYNQPMEQQIDDHFCCNHKVSKVESDLENSAASVSYADILLRRDSKRKLSENSITDEDYEFDCENRN